MQATWVHLLICIPSGPLGPTLAFVATKDRRERVLGWPCTTPPPGFVLCPLPPGYGFLPPAQAEMLARQQELLRKQNLAR